MNLKNVLEKCTWLVLLAATVIATPAQTFTTLVYFNGSNAGEYPQYGPLIQGADGSFYGTTLYGGSSGGGIIFKVSPAGVLTTVHTFDFTDGGTPYTGLILATDGNFYGTTYSGGSNASNGTFYKLSADGILTTLHNFDISIGARPTAALTQAASGAFYGTTSISEVGDGLGSIFRITPAGALTTLFNFDLTTGGDAFSGLVQATNGYFYGTTSFGGTHNDGTVFRISSAGAFTTLHNFGGTDGAGPTGGLIQAADGNLYGTTDSGGFGGNGTVFKMTPGGTLTTLHSFHKTDGGLPVAGLIQATDGNFYGTTSVGGSANAGTIFSITPSGTLTTLHELGSGQGFDSLAPLVQGTDGSFYGTTSRGGNGFPALGTVFKISVGLGPFVRLVPTSGKVGTTVSVLGTDLTGASGVSFNGTEAAFTVVSATQIRTAVPAGATTGKIRVVTPRGTLLSNVAYRVKP